MTDIKCSDCIHWECGQCLTFRRLTEHDFYCKGFQRKTYFKAIHKPRAFFSGGNWCIEFHDGCVVEVYDVIGIDQAVQLESIVRWLNKKILPYLLKNRPE